MSHLRYLIPIIVLTGAAVLYKSGHDPKPLQLKENFQTGRGANDRSLQPFIPDEYPSRSLVNQKNIPHTSTPSTAAPNKQQASQEELNKLTDVEQKSLWVAFSEARREIRPIPESHREREENLGYDFYALHPKQNLTTRFGAQGVQFVSSNRTYTEDDRNNPTTTWTAQMHILSLAGKATPLGANPEKTEAYSTRVEYQHSPELTEWYDNGVTAMEHGFTLTQRPAHLKPGEDVVIEVALNGLNAAAHTAEDGTFQLNFNEGDRTVLSYSKLLVVDAQGKELPATMKPTDTGFSFSYHDAQAAYPVTVDPLIVNEETKLHADDAAAVDIFGFSVAISGDSVVVGAYADDAAAVDSGSAYVFTRSGTSWSQQAKLTADDAAENDRFGYSVAISGDTIVVGADLDDDGGSGSGSAYVFTRSGTSWSQQAKLTASDAAEFDRFGFSVAISGDSVVVGAHFDDSAAFGDSGSAYVFTRNGTSWFQQAKLTAGDAAAGDFFGRSVAISGDSIVVGAYLDDDDGSASGSAYVFNRSGTSWFLQAKLTANDAVTNDNFGYAVAISGDSVVVGAIGDDPGAAFDSGSAYVFNRSGTSWSQQAKISAGDPGAEDGFGSSVAISGDSVVVGAFENDDAGSTSGSAYVFTRDGTSWSQQAKLTAGDAAAEDRFGFSVAISGNSVVVGAYLDDDGDVNTGSIYIYRIVVSGIAKLLVHDPIDLSVLSGSNANPFPAQQPGTSINYTFRLANAGELDLDIQSISLGGANATQFSLTVPDISSSTDLSSSQSLEFTVTFSPAGSSALRNATATIVSNDSSTPTFSFDISGLGLSNSTDGDGDGMNDWAEFSLRNFGFDWEMAQPDRVNEYYNLASTAGLFTQSEAAAVTGSAVLSDVNTTTNTAIFTIKLLESLDLQAFTPLIADPGKLSVDGNGNISYEVTAPSGKKFYRAGFED
ncbi:MAG: hypothetical protein ACSHX9_07730 [Luteolibacter sp.]